MNDNQKRAIRRIPATLHLDAARLAKNLAMRNQDEIEATLQFLADLRRQLAYPPTLGPGGAPFRTGHV